MPAEPERHLALVGATATGKSTIAIEAARQCDDVEVVTVDSMQVYRGMDIGTAKPTMAQRADVRHHLLDLAEPGERFTVTRFVDAAHEALGEIEGRGHIGLIVGGTGLYLQALLGDVSPPGEWPAARAALDAQIDEHPQGPHAGVRELHARLATADPVAASRIEPSNRRRVVRALEVIEGGGRRFSDYGPGVGAYAPPVLPVAIIGVWLPRVVVAARIEARVHDMIGRGLVAEVRSLLRRPGGIGPTARQALGYRELLAHVERGHPLEAAVDDTVRRTRQFSVRQRRWFRRDPRIRWYGTERNPVAVVPAVLRELQRCRTR